MKRVWAVLATAVVLGMGSAPEHAAAAPQAPATAPAPAAPPAPRPADVASPDAIIAALYAVISGDAGVARDWDRFRSLFHPSARMIPTGATAGSAGRAGNYAEDYIRFSGPLLVERGFHERELARRTEAFGPLLHAFSTYDSKTRSRTRSLSHVGEQHPAVQRRRPLVGS
jgi:nucleoid-associated protein YgaU